MNHPILLHKPGFGNQDPYWFGKINGHDLKFIRMFAGVSMPILDRQLGAVFVVGERYSTTMPQDLRVLDGEIGEWAAVQNAIVQFRQDLKFNTIITDTMEACQFIRRNRAINRSTHEVPVGIYNRPDYAVTEVGRSTVDNMCEEGRLHTDLDIIALLNEDASARALQSVVCFMREYPAHYKPLNSSQAGMGRILGVDGL